MCKTLQPIIEFYIRFLIRFSVFDFRTRIVFSHIEYKFLCHVYSFFYKKKVANNVATFFKLKCFIYYISIGGKQSPPASGQQFIPASPISVYVSPGQQPFASGFTPPSQVIVAVCSATSSGCLG